MKKCMYKAAFAALLLLFSFAATAGAVLYTVEDNIANGTLITQGSQVTGTFDLNSQLAADPNYNAPYDISSATATFSFSDDGDVTYRTSRTVTQRSNWNTCEGNRYQTRTTYDYFVDEYEQVQVSMGLQVSQDGTNWYSVSAVDYRTSSTATNSHRHEYTYSCGLFGWSTCTDYYTHYVYTHYQTNNIDETEGYNGNLVITTVLNTDNLDDLSLDGLIEFTVDGQNGDMILNSATLTADVNPNPAPVPEPATALFLLTGIIGLAGLCRRKK